MSPQGTSDTGPIRPGLVVIDDHERTGIVRRKEPRPTAKWLSELLHADGVAALPANVQWWGVLPLEGGYILCPEALLRPLRDATYHDFLVAVDHGNEAARRALAELFPGYVQRAAASIAGRE